MASTEEQRATDTPTGYAAAPTLRVRAENGIDYAHRDLGEGDVPLVLLQHFRGSLDNWDPALVDELAADRSVVAFDNVGVAGTTRTTPHTVEAMAHDAIAFIEAMSFEPIDLLGFSIGGFVAQEIARVVARLAEWVGERLPDLAGPATNTETCLYTVAANEEFLLFREGRVVVGAACSGHAFKFATATGQRLASLALQ